MRFIDEVTFTVHGGRGGDGCMSFRREKFVPKGGPDGGDGGDGGDVILKVKSNLSTLLDLRHSRVFKAKKGENGRGKNQHGKRGETVVISVPQGTLVYNGNSKELLDDLVEVGQELIVAQGGRGGRGNARFTSSTRQTPDFAEKGKPGKSGNIRLELKLLADVGLVGFPNAGKSTLLSAISAAKPKIADYPFTTLVPHLGIIRYGEFQHFVMADIPGLIQGAHMGKGVGDRFLRHIERTRVLVFLIDSTTESIESNYQILVEEMCQFGSNLIEKPRLVALSKVDLLSDEEKKRLPKKFDQYSCLPLSSVTKTGVNLLVQQIVDALSHSKPDG